MNGMDYGYVNYEYLYETLNENYIIKLLVRFHKSNYIFIKYGDYRRILNQKLIIYLTKQMLIHKPIMSKCTII
jgi:hypothetical protein